MGLLVVCCSVCNQEKGGSLFWKMGIDFRRNLIVFELWILLLLW